MVQKSIKNLVGPCGSSEGIGFSWVQNRPGMLTFHVACTAVLRFLGMMLHE